MGNFQTFWVLLKKEFLLEYRQRYAISGILLYVFSTVFIIYTAFVRVDPQVWNTLFWMVMLFASVNAVAKSFLQENGARQLYYYQIADPLSVIFAKMVYNTLLLLVLGLLAFGAFWLFAGNPVRNEGLFFIAVLLGSLGFSITFTFVSAISAKTNNSATLMAILSFPLVIPILMTLIKITANALALIQDTSVDQDIYILIAIDLMLTGIAMVLFPFLWKE
jgi:heme exporter protein B